MKEYAITLTGFAVAAALFLILVTFDLDFFENLILLLRDLEHFEIDELLFPFLVIVVFALVDALKKRRAYHLKLEKLKIYNAMLASTHHILNNFLNQMQLFKITAEDTPGFDPEVLALFDEIIKDATTQIEALSSVASIDAESIQASLFRKSSSFEFPTGGGDLG